MAAVERVVQAVARPALPSSVGGIAPVFVLGGDERLRLLAANSAAGVTIVAVVRRQGTDGRVQYDKYTFVPTTDRSITTQDFGLAAGALLSVALFVEGATPQIGQTFVQASLVLGSSGATQLLGTLAQSYITARQPAVWPGTPLRQSVEGPGAIMTVLSAAAGAGVPALLTCPAGARWHLRACRGAIQLGGVAKRFRVWVNDGTSGAQEVLGPADQGAGTTVVYQLVPGLPSADYSAARATMQVNYPATNVIRGGDVVNFTTTAGIGGADTVFQFVAVVEEWLEFT